MFKVLIVSLFAVCSAVEVLEVSGSKVVRHSQTHLPLRSVSGAFSTLPGLSQVRSPLSLHLGGGLRTVGFNGLQNVGLNTIGYNTVGLNNVGLNTVNVAPSLYSYLPFGHQHHNLQRLSVPQYQTIQVEQPAVRAISLARPSLTYAQPQLSLAAIRPQVLTTAHQQVHPVNAAIHQVGRTVEYRTVPYNDQPIVAQDIVVEPSDQPINIHFKSRSSTVRLSQEHIAGEPGSVEQTQSQDEPSKVVHEVVKPVIQEVREVIQPYRQLTQEVQPVVENVHTVVSQGEGVRQQYVAEPVARPVQVQQLAVQPIHVQQPVQQVVQVAQPVQHQIQVAQVQPVHHQVAVEPVQVAQFQHVQQVPVQYAQVEAPINYQTVQVQAQPLVRSFGVAQQVVGPQIARFSVAQPHLAIRNVREQVVARETPVLKQSGDFVKFAESD